MSNYEDLKREYAHAPPEQRLEILRHELLRPILTVQGVATLLRQLGCASGTDLPQEIASPEFEQVIKWLAEAGCDLQEILDALTPAPA